MTTSFVQSKKPMICGMVQRPTPESCIENIKSCLRAGADAIGLQLCVLEPQYRTPQHLCRIFEACGPLPIYITNYRRLHSLNHTDEERAQLLLDALACGATLCDISGDLFCQSQYEMTFDETAVKKQMELARKVHDLGKEVLFSSHTKAYLDESTIREFALALQARGADIVKIVNHANTEEQLAANINNIILLNRDLDVRLLYLTNGKFSQILRHIGANLGVCMYLGVYEHTPFDTAEQPLLEVLYPIRQNMPF